MKKLLAKGNVLKMSMFNLKNIHAHMHKHTHRKGGGERERRREGKRNNVHHFHLQLQEKKQPLKELRMISTNSPYPQNLENKIKP